MSLQTPLARVRGLGSAKEGSHHWRLQRLTSIALVPLSIWFVVSVVAMAGADYPAIVEWIRSPIVSVLLVLFIITLFYHAQLGVQVVIEDYVHSEWLRITVLVGTQFLLILLGLAAVIAVLRIALGAR